MYNNRHVVFYTTFDKYMTDALRASTCDIVKTLPIGELLQIVKRVKHEKGNNPINFELCCCSVIPKYSISSTPTRAVAET